MSLIAITVRQIINGRPWDWAADKEAERNRKKSNSYNERTKQRCEQRIMEAVLRHQPASSEDVAKAIGWTSRIAATERLKKLVDDGKLKRSKLRGNSYLYEVVR